MARNIFTESDIRDLRVCADALNKLTAELDQKPHATDVRAEMNQMRHHIAGIALCLGAFVFWAGVFASMGGQL